MAVSELVKAETPDNTYYRSQLYTSYQGINPLITASHPILSIIDRIKLSHGCNLTQSFYQNLQHELKAFESRATDAEYDHETIFIASFLLSATIDELVLDKHTFETFKRLMPASESSQQTPDVQFFKILDRIIDKPEHYLDLLELIYLCLSLGFEGKYKYEAHEKLKNITQELYDKITPLREQQTKPLFKKEEPSAPAKRYHTVAISSGLLILMALMYMTSNYLLDQSISTTSTPSILVADNRL